MCVCVCVVYVCVPVCVEREWKGERLKGIRQIFYHCTPWKALGLTTLNLKFLFENDKVGQSLRYF